MTDENGRRSVSMPEEQPNDYAGHAAEVGKSAIEHMAPAEKGWILAAVILMISTMAILEVTNYLENTHRAEAASKYLVELETNRAQEVRRAQESSRILAQALSRQADRIGRKVNEVKATDFVGPPEP